MSKLSPHHLINHINSAAAAASLHYQLLTSSWLCLTLLHTAAWVSWLSQISNFLALQTLTGPFCCRFAAGFSGWPRLDQAVQQMLHVWLWNASDELKSSWLSQTETIPNHPPATTVLTARWDVFVLFLFMTKTFNHSDEALTSLFPWESLTTSCTCSVFHKLHH